MRSAASYIGPSAAKEGETRGSFCATGIGPDSADVLQTNKSALYKQKYLNFF